jgi:hypothetical protein
MATQSNDSRKNILPGVVFNDPETNISPIEKELLDNAGEDDEERALHQAEVDKTDEDGDLLNENAGNDGNSGSELDIPGSEDDDDQEEIGEEDEENNGYSQADNGT